MAVVGPMWGRKRSREHWTFQGVWTASPKVGARTPGPEATPPWTQGTQKLVRPIAPNTQPTLHRRGEGVREKGLEPGISPSTA